MGDGGQRGREAAGDVYRKQMQDAIAAMRAGAHPARPQRPDGMRSRGRLHRSRPGSSIARWERRRGSGLAR